MITNPYAVRVLCFGDSNTHGMSAVPGELRRLPIDVRWTGRLQMLLGDAYEIIEEGRAGRTVEVTDPNITGTDGRAYFVPCLRTHNPLDVVLIMLGTNDAKWKFGRTADDVVASLGRLVDDAETHAFDRAERSPRVVLVAPAPVELRPDNDEFDADSVGTATDIAPLLRKLAADRGAVFVDAGTVAAVGDDGVHLSGESHPRLAELFADTIRSL